MRDILFKAGIPSYTTSIITPLPVSGQLQIPIAKTIPQQIGLIFGMAAYCNRVSTGDPPTFTGPDPSGNILISDEEAAQLYMVLKDGPTEFFQNVRLLDMDFVTPSRPGHQYLPVNIPGNFDMSTSYYVNPSLLVSPAPPETPIVIMLELWFVSTEAYKWMMKKGYVDAEFAEQFIKSKNR